MTNSALDAAGAVWLQETLKVPHTASGIITIAQFDPLTGAQSAAQAIGAYFDDALAEQHTPFMLEAPQNGRLLVATNNNGALGASTQGAAALDVTKRSRGDLVVSVTTDRRASSVGGVVGSTLSQRIPAMRMPTGSTCSPRFPGRWNRRA